MDNLDLDCYLMEPSYENQIAHYRDVPGISTKLLAHVSVHLNAACPVEVNATAKSNIEMYG